MVTGADHKNIKDTRQLSNDTSELLSEYSISAVIMIDSMMSEGMGRIHSEDM